MWATEDKQESDWEDDDSMDSAKEVVDVDKVSQARKMFGALCVLSCSSMFFCLMSSYLSLFYFSSDLDAVRGLKIIPGSLISGVA